MWRSLAVVALIAGGCTCGSSASLTRDEAARTCVTLKACFPQEWNNQSFGTDLFTCTTELWSQPLPGTVESIPVIATGMEAPYLAFYRCIAAAGGDCTAADKCFTTDPNCTFGSLRWGGVCKGTAYQGCSSNGRVLRLECAEHGEQCGTGDGGGNGECNFGFCEGQQRTCRGNRAEICAFSRITLVDCGRIGRSCGAIPDGGVDCLGGAACDLLGTPRCEGDVVVQCNADGREVRIDCTRAPTLRTCRAGKCALTGTECDQKFAEVCAGNTLRFCADGQVRDFDCVAMGFRACETGACRQ
jgi:hypothetical protein